MPHFPHTVLFFDGYCNLCSRAVQFILKHEANDSLKFASLQGELARQLLPHHMLQPIPGSLVVYAQNGTIYASSRAAFEVSRFLKPPWRWLRIFRFLPTALTDAIYAWVARNRYAWFGKRETCFLPAENQSHRFPESI